MSTKLGKLEKAVVDCTGYPKASGKEQSCPIKPSTFCDGCDETFSVQDFLSCKKDGLIIKNIRRHHEVIGYLMGDAWGSYLRESIAMESMMIQFCVLT
ncbi:unnamed protein product [Brassicogethes aeneus]|uniref:Uncharacterized protein n=1 Tax=Brassicogethes aeneus TaxID=1431903 RepID=A0A9P0AS16_BRAAE|nr:unnamed protein product [Brassicogethes aeneus]